MGHQDKMDADGERNDGLSYESAASRLHNYAEGREQLEAFQEPVLLHAGSPHERLYIAALDGTGNDVIHDPDHATNVGLIAKQIQASQNPNLGVGYVPGRAPSNTNHSRACGTGCEATASTNVPSKCTSCLSIKRSSGG